MKQSETIPRFQTGFIPSYPLPQDYKMGGETTMQSIARRVADWKLYAPAFEHQYMPTFDTLSCTSFSYSNVVEFQMNYLINAGIASGEFSATSVQWLKDNGYIESNGKVNLSDRFLAIMSGTTERGNDFRSVAECARTIGMIPDADLPLGGATQAEYLNKALITPAMLAKAKAFLNIIKLEWEWIWSDMSAGFNEDYQVVGTIEQTPIQIGIATPATHATCLATYDHATKTFTGVFDTYEPFWFSNTADAYNPQQGMRIYVSENKPVTPAPLPTPAQFTFKNVLVYGNKSKDVVVLQRVLISLGLLKVGLDTGNFFDQTLQAVKNFQLRYGINPTGNVGVITMAKLNQILLNPPKQTISPAGLAMLKKFEGLGDGNKATSILEPYQDQVGNWTIGYGNTYINGVKVTAQTAPITQAQADALLLSSLEGYMDIVRRSIAVPINQNQFDALTSFCFNLGSLLTLAGKINAGKIMKEDFGQYVYAKGVKLPVLVSRRQQEADYYFKQ